MSELLPFHVEGPVKYFKILTNEEKLELLKSRIIQPNEIEFRVMAFYDKQKRVIGYDIEEFSLQ